MRNYTGKLVAALITAALMVTVIFTGCAENKDPVAEKLREDIVGIWMSEGGSQPVMNEGMEEYYYMFYEFTSDGKLVYHLLYERGDVYDDANEYTINGSYLVVNGAKCLVTVEGDKMVMTNNNGEDVYERLSPEEAFSVGLFYQDPVLYKVEESVMLDYQVSLHESESLAAEEKSETAESETSGSGEEESAEETISASESSAETEAAAEEAAAEDASVTDETEAPVTEEE